MPLLDSLAQDDSDRLFADWGRPAVLEEISRYYDPETGQLEESETPMDVTLVVGPSLASERSPTQARLPVRERTFLIRDRDLPSGISFTSARIRLDDQIYVIQSVVDSPLNGVLALHCVGEHPTPDSTDS